MANVKALLAAAVLPAALLAGCGAGEDRGPEIASLRARVQAQEGEVQALRNSVKDLEARSRSLEEQVAAARPGTAGPAAAAAPGGAEGPGAASRPAESPSPDAAGDSVAAFLDTERGRQKLREVLQAETRRRQDEGVQQWREQLQVRLKERVEGYLTEQLNLDANQQQAVLAIATDATQRVGEAWFALRDNPGDAALVAQARDRTNEVRQEALGKLQQALTVDQYNKLQELEGGPGSILGGRGMGGGFGGPGFGGPGAGPGGVAPRGR